MKLIFRYMQKKDRIILAAVMLFVILQVILETKIPVIMGDISTMLQDGSMTMDLVRSKGLQMLVYALVVRLVNTTGWFAAMIFTAIYSLTFLVGTFLLPDFDRPGGVYAHLEEEENP